MEKRKLFLLVITVCFFIRIINIPVWAEKKYDTDFIITNYDIILKTDFNKNEVNIQVKVDAKNVSKPSNNIIIWLCSQGNTDDFSVIFNRISRIDDKKKLDLEFRQKEINGINYPVYVIDLKKQIRHDEKFQLEFDYKIMGKQTEKCFPISKGTEKELYLITDFKWLPMVNEVTIPGQFANLYKPTWSLKLIYPSFFVAAINGKLVKRHHRVGIIEDEWESIIGGFPQVFVSQYDVIRKKRGKFNLEIYYPQDKAIKDAANKLKDDIFEILEIYFKLYGNPGSSTYRLVTSYTPWGAHGLFMGQVIHHSYLRINDIKTIAHEIAHTWWGNLITSYNEGSKFLREAMANYSAAIALKKIKGEEYTKNFWRDCKWRAFFPFYLTLDNEKTHYPLIIQEGFDYRGSVYANYKKGAMVLRILQLELGDDTFFRVLKTIASRFRNSNITMKDFIGVLNQEAQKNMTPLIKNLCWETGYPIYSIKSFESKKKNGKFQTFIKIKNDGEFVQEIYVIDDNIITGNWPFFETMAAVVAEKILYPKGNGPFNKLPFNSNPVFRAIQNSGNTRMFLKREIDKNIVNEIIRAGIKAPIIDNEQLLKFVIVKNQDIKDKIRDILIGSLKDYYKRGGVSTNRIKHYYSNVFSAPAHIFVFIDYKIKEGEILEEGRKLKKIIEISMACQNIIIATEALNLGGLIVDEILTVEEKIKTLLNVPKSAKLIIDIAIGYPKFKILPQIRKPFGKVVFNEIWGKK